MHFQQQLYARLLPDVQRCRTMEEAASLITRLAERDELADLARASQAARMAPQAVSRPHSALMGELEERAAVQQEPQGRQQPQQQGQPRRDEQAWGQQQARQQRQDRQRDERQQRQQGRQREQRQPLPSGRQAAAAAGAAAARAAPHQPGSVNVGEQLTQQRSSRATHGNAAALEEGNWVVVVSTRRREVTLHRWIEKQPGVWNREQSCNPIAVAGMVGACGLLCGPCSISNIPVCLAQTLPTEPCFFGCASSRLTAPAFLPAGAGSLHG